jgi:RNA polymerase sigma-70 factor (ECF subfamily)
MDSESAATWQERLHGGGEVETARSTPSAHLRVGWTVRPPERPRRRARLSPAKSATLDDGALARLLALGDENAASALWTRYARLVRNLLRRALGASGDVEDLVQDAFVGLFRTLPGLREPEALRSFVVGTALRIARNELRRRRVRRCISYMGGFAMPDSPQQGGSDPEARRALRRLYEVLAEVDERGRLAFELRHLEGHDLAEIAGLIDCSLATTKRVLAKAEQRVRAMAKGDPLLAAYAPRDASKRLPRRARSLV